MLVNIFTKTNKDMFPDLYKSKQAIKNPNSPLGFPSKPSQSLASHIQRLLQQPNFSDLGITCKL